MAFEIEVSGNTLKRLRKLRLWHWQEAVRYRANARGAVLAHYVSYYNVQADMHIRAVQTLNDFFPRDGDTAENDDEAERERLKYN